MQFGDGFPDAFERVSLAPISLRKSSANLEQNRFHDHQMITSRKDILGTELLSLPFRREELEAILEDLVS